MRAALYRVKGDEMMLRDTYGMLYRIETENLEKGSAERQRRIALKMLEDSIAADPTISNLQTEVDEQDNGLFAFTFTYSAGATEGSPAGFYFIHYQKAQQGVISVNGYTDRSSNSEEILKLINSIQPVTENAVEYQS